MSVRAERVSAANVGVQKEASTLEHSYGKKESKMSYGAARGGWIWAILLFIFFVFIVFIILVAWAPKWLCRNRRGQGSNEEGSRGKCNRNNRRRRLDYGKLFLWAIVVSVIAVLLFWLLTGITAGLASLFMGKKKKQMSGM